MNPSDSQSQMFLPALRREVDVWRRLEAIRSKTNAGKMAMAKSTNVTEIWTKGLGGIVGKTVKAAAVAAMMPMDAIEKASPVRNQIYGRSMLHSGPGLV